MQMLYGYSQAVIEWVGQFIEGGERGFDNGVAIGVVNAEGSLVAGIVYHNWAPGAGVIEMTAAATDPRWMTRNVLRSVFLYPFGQIGCQAVVFLRNSDNERVGKLLRGIGVTEYEIPRLGGVNTSKFVGVLTREDFMASRWMRKPQQAPGQSDVVPLRRAG